MPTFDQIRQQFPEAKDLSDAQIVQRTADLTGSSLRDVANSFGYQMPSSDLGKEVQSGFNAYAGNMGRLGDAVGRSVGLDSFADAARGYAERREASSKVLQGSSNAPHSMDEIKLGDSDKGVLPYLGQLGAGALPYVAEQATLTGADALTGGATVPAHLASLAGRARLGVGAGEAGLKALMESGLSREAATQALGSTVAKGARNAAVDALPMTGGALTQQYDQSGTYDLPSAAVAGTLSAGIGQLAGVQGLINRGGVPIARSIESRMSRSLLAGATGAAEQSGAMVGMEAANIGARKAVDPNVSYTSDDSIQRYKEAAFGGAALGGALGLVHGGASSRAKTGSEVGDAVASGDNTVDAGQGNRPALGYSPLAGTIYAHPDGSASLSSDMAARGAPEVPQGQPAPPVLDPAAQAGAAAAAPPQKAPKGPPPATQEERAAMFQKYGEPEEMHPLTDGKPDTSKPPMGFEWDGKKYYTPDALTKALDKQVLEERAKSPIEHQAEAALADTVDGHMGPKEITKYQDLYKDAPTIDVVTQRIEHEMADPMEKLQKEQAKGDDKANFKTIDKLQTKVDFYQKWLDNLKDKNGKDDVNEGSGAAQDTSGEGNQSQAPRPVDPVSTTGDRSGESSRTESQQPGQQGRDAASAVAQDASRTQATQSPGIEGREQVRLRGEPENAQQVLTPADKTRLALEAQQLHERVQAGTRLPAEQLTKIADHHASEDVRREYAPFATREAGLVKDGYASKLSDAAKEAELKRIDDAQYMGPKGPQNKFIVDTHAADGVSGQKIADRYNALNPDKKPISRQAVQNILSEKERAKRLDNAYDALGIKPADRDVLEAHRARMDAEARAEKESQKSAFDEAREGTGSDKLDHNTSEGMGTIGSSGGTQLNLKEKASLGERFANATTDAEREALVAEAKTLETKVQKKVAKGDAPVKKVIDPDAKKKVLAAKREDTNARIEASKTKAKETNALSVARDNNTFTGQHPAAGRLVGYTQPRGTTIEKLFSNFADQKSDNTPAFRESMFKRANKAPRSIADEAISTHSELVENRLTAKIDAAKKGNTRVQLVDPEGKVVAAAFVEKGMVDSIAVPENAKGNKYGEKLLKYLDAKGIANIYEVPDRSPGFVNAQKSILGAKDTVAATQDKKPEIRVVKKGTVEVKKPIDPKLLEEIRQETRAKEAAELKKGKDAREVAAAQKKWDNAPGKDDLPDNFPQFRDLSPDLQREAAKLDSIGALSMKNMNDIYERHVAELESREAGTAAERAAAKAEFERLQSRADERGDDDLGYPEDHDHDTWFSKSVNDAIPDLGKQSEKVQGAVDRLTKFIGSLDKDRTQTSLEKTDLAAKSAAVVEFMENMNKAGILHHLDAVKDWKLEDLGAKDFGTASINADGTYSITLNERLLKPNKGYEDWAHQQIADTLAHETAHVMDMVGALGEGVYSGQPELRFSRTIDDSLRGQGVVSRELLGLRGRDGSIISAMLDYPLGDKFVDMPRRRVQEEVFAQLQAIFLDPEASKDLRSEAPQAYKFMQEVMKDGQSTEAVRRPTESIADQRQESFRQRKVDAEGSDRSTGTGSGNDSESEPYSRGNGFPDAPRFSKSAAGAEHPAIRAERLYDDITGRRELPSLSGNEGLIDKSIGKLPEVVQAPVTSIMTTMGNLSRKTGYTTLFGHDLADLARTQFGMEKPKEFMNLVSQNAALKASLDLGVQKIGAGYNKLSDPIKLQANTFLHDSTMQSKWGFKPDYRDVQVDPAMKVQFERLPAEARKVVKDVFEHGHDTNRMINDLITDNVRDLYEKKLEGTTGEERANIEKERDARIEDIQSGQMDGPYAPLQRFGNHVAVGKSKEYRLAEAEAEKTGDYSDLRELRTNPDHYTVEMHDTAGKADAAARLMERKFGKDGVDAQEKDVFAQRNHAEGWKLMQDVKENLMSGLEGQDKAAAAKVSDMLRDMYIHTLSESSFRRSMLRRENISGVNKNQMFRGFLSRASAAHHFIANLTNGEKISRALSDMKQEVKAGGDRELRAKRQEINNEFIKRREAMTYQADTFIQNNIMAFTGIHSLLTSPAHFLQYITQPLTMHMPLIAGRHGYFHAVSEMSTAFRDTIKMVKGQDHDMTMLKSRGESGRREYEMLKNLVDNGTLSQGREQEFGDPRLHVDSPGSKLWNATIQKMAKIPHTLENFNKIGSALASYRMAHATELRAGTLPDVAHAKAMEQAMADLRSAYGSYDSFNSPRLFQQGGVFKTLPIKLMTQFRKFQVIHMSMLGRLMHGAFKGESPEVRAVAQKQLAFMAAHYSVFAGAMGVPASHMLLAVVHKIFGNDDPEEDKEQWVRGLIGDKDISELVLHGLPAFGGADVSNTTGAGDIASLFREGTGDTGDAKKDYQAYVMATMGPFAGTVLPNMLTGAANIAKGDYYKGLEGVLPKGIANVMKAYGLGQDGFVNKKGDQLISPDDITLFDQLTQGLGAPSTKVTEINRERNVEYRYESHFKDLTNQIKLDYTRALRQGDADEAATARERWQKMQEDQARVGFKMTPLSTLIKAPAEQRKRESSEVGGLMTNKNNRQFVQTLTDQ